MDRFASGQTTSKFEVPLPANISNTMEEFASIQKGQIEEVRELKESVNKQFSELNETYSKLYNETNSRIDPVIQWHRECSTSVQYHDIQISNLIRFMASNALIRFLNFHVFHWFTIMIAENRYPMHGNHDKYYAYITLVCPDEETWFGHYGSAEYKKNRKKAFKEQYKTLKTHLKEIKSEGYNLSNIRFRF